MMTNGAISSDVGWNAGRYIEPDVQLADGSYAGFFDIGLGRFDGNGNVRWIAGAYNSASMATADGGVIADDGTIFDANGNATGQLSGLPTFSWKGAYQLGSVRSMVPELDLASTISSSTFAAVPGGNLTGNGFALNHHTFGIVFCGPGFELSDGWHGGDGSCPLSIPDAKFSYIPGIDDSHLTCESVAPAGCTLDFSHQYPSQADKIKIQALNWYRRAFDHLPAIVKAKKQPSFLYGGSDSISKFEHTVYVRGDWVPNGQDPRKDLSSPPSGWTPLNLTGATNTSFIYYLPTMGQAQVELGSPGQGSDPYQYLRPPYPPSDAQSTDDFQKLVAGIGTAIGNVGAHETGHQLNVPFMECNYTTCEDHNVYLFQFDTTDTWSFTGNPKMTWGTAGSCWIENYLIPQSCKQ